MLRMSLWAVPRQTIPHHKSYRVSTHIPSVADRSRRLPKEAAHSALIRRDNMPLKSTSNPQSTSRGQAPPLLLCLCHRKRAENVE